MLVSEFHYDLRRNALRRSRCRIAPVAPAACDPATRRWQDRSFREFPALLRPDDLLVVNNTRVSRPGFLATAAASEPRPWASTIRRRGSTCGAG